MKKKLLAVLLTGVMAASFAGTATVVPLIPEMTIH